MNLEILPQAQADIQQAARFYKSQRIGLDDEFLAEVEAAKAAILKDPLLFAQARPGIHRYLLDRFPYGVYYRLPNPYSIRILVVKHHSRRPGFGLHRK